MSDDQKNPAPEVLEVQSDSPSEKPDDIPLETEAKPETTIAPAKRRIAYKPSHKATFIGLAVVAVILAANALVITFILRGQTDSRDAAIRNGVTLSGEVLGQLGVSRNPAGNAETLLVVGPKSQFNDSVTMGSDVTIAGQLILNSRFRASEASVSTLQAGNTQVEQLNVNGDGTVTNVNVRRDLQVAGVTRIQGQLTVNQLTTINNNLNVAGNLAVGGSLSVRNFQVGSLTITGHLLSSGAAPGVARGGAVGSNGTVSISGNDTAGTVAVNTGVGAGNGLLASVSFNENYTNTPHVVVSPIGRSVPGLYINRTSAGFSISVDGAMPPGGYAFDYVIVQ